MKDVLLNYILFKEKYQSTTVSDELNVRKPV